MSIEKCRVCGFNLFSDPLLKYEHMPKSAQFLPDQSSLKEDKEVTIEVCQCSGCGLVQLNSEPVSYYREVIRASGFSREMQDFRKEQFGAFIKKAALNGKKIIEIGSGRGEYLSILGQSDVVAYGLEYSSDSVAACVKNGLQVSQGFIDSGGYKLKDAPFDAFFIFSFLEHLPEPITALKGIAHNLTDSAVGLVEVPNFDMILKNRLFSEFIFDHLFYFTKETLSTALNMGGFEVIDCSEVWHDYIISATVRPTATKPSKTKLADRGVKKIVKLDISDFTKHQSMLKREIEEYISGFKEKEVAIWGAGHQALAVIALTGIAGKIKYVIDSAIFKQGKFTPATHIPIVASEMLDQDPVEAVIVMAASYSDEVVKIMRERFDQSIKLSILRDSQLEVMQ
ncbi:MAG: methionine biosynthesis protein MetW [Candidatus Omnitrophota bacterium]